MGTINRVIVVGRLTHDPEVRYTTDEKPVARFGLAVQGQSKKKDDVNFMNVVAWGNLAKICGEYLKKGKLIAIEGRLQVRKWKAKDGSMRTATDIIASEVQMLDRKFYGTTEAIENESNKSE